MLNRVMLFLILMSSVNVFAVADSTLEKEVSGKVADSKAPVKKIIEGASLKDLYKKFSSHFEKLSQGEIKKILQSVTNQKLISNSSDSDYKKLFEGPDFSDGKEIAHEIIIYWGAFPLGSKKEEEQKEGIRTSLATIFQETVLKNKKVDKALLSQDISAMKAMGAYLENPANAKQVQLPAGMIPKLPAKKEKK